MNINKGDKFFIGSSIDVGLRTLEVIHTSPVGTLFRVSSGTGTSGYQEMFAYANDRGFWASIRKEVS